MSTELDFLRPWLLVLLPLAGLPLLRRRSDTLAFSWLPWLPRDRAGRAAGALWRSCAVLALLTTLVALAGPGRPETAVERTGLGAEILVLMDRSRSMDDRMLPSDWRTVDRRNLLYHLGRGPRKAAVARDLLSKFVARRPQDRFSLMLFSTRPMHVVDFTHHDEVVQAGIAAAGTGRGLSNTDVGRALLEAIAQFDGREYSGSRIILLLSDGGTHIRDEARRRIEAGLLRNRIAMYWLYLRSYNSPSLADPGERHASSPAIALHRFFQGLSTPYRFYEAEVPEDLAKAVADVGRQQNLPLDFQEQIPRKDYSPVLLGIGAVCCLVLLLYRLMQLRSWS